MAKCDRPRGKMRQFSFLTVVTRLRNIDLSVDFEFAEIFGEGDSQGKRGVVQFVVKVLHRLHGGAVLKEEKKCTSFKPCNLVCTMKGKI